jgi:glycerol-3-phosphate acyltransferase PlsY
MTKNKNNSKNRILNQTTVPWLEIRRKIMHLYPLAIPIVYHYISRETALMILIPIGAGYVFCDIFRHVHQGFKRLFDRLITSRFLREHEKYGLIGSSYFVFGAVASIILFPKPVAIASLYILIFCDASAGIVGSGWGRTRIFGKSLEGSLAFFVAGMIVIAFTMRDNLLWGTLAVIGGALVELIPTGLDDNFTIPVVAGAIMAIGFWF